jgi:hypothetical protein
MVIPFGSEILPNDQEIPPYLHSSMLNTLLGSLSRYAVAGWLETYAGSTFSRDRIPKYAHSLHPRSLTRHYHVRDNEVVYGRMSQDTCEKEWLE